MTEQLEFVAALMMWDGWNKISNNWNAEKQTTSSETELRKVLALEI